ncbi:MAG: hypothetical protein U0R28_02180 [Candidatus Nanopelagicales bacterium]
MKLIALASVAALTLVGAAIPAQAASTTTTCTALKAKVTKAAKSGKNAKAKRLKQKYRSCRSVASIRSQLANYTFTGMRGDGQAVSITLCDSGAWSTQIGSRPVATNSGTTWLVRYPQYTSASKWVTQVADKPDRAQGGWSVGFARDGDAFQFGIASFDQVTSLGSVTRSAATGC